MNLKLLPILLVSLCTNSVKAQNDILWEKRIEQQKSSYLYNAISTPDYGILLLGSTLSSDIGDNLKKNNGQSDYYLVKINEDGNIEWENSFGGNKIDQLLNAKPTRDGGYILIGTSNSDLSGDKSSKNLGQNDIWVIKLDPKGKITWDETIGGIGDDIPVDIIQTNNNEYIIAGISNSPSVIKSTRFQNSTSFLVKLDTNGQKKWEKLLSDHTTKIIKNIFLDNNSFKVLGNDESGGKSSFFSNSYDHDGNIISEILYDDNYLMNVIKSDNQYYLTLKDIKGSETINKLIVLDENMSQVSSTTLEIKNNLDLKEIFLNKDYIISTSNQINTLDDKKTSKIPESYYNYETFDLSGKKLNSKKLGLKGYNYLEKSIITRDNSIILFGSSSEIKNNLQDNSQLYLVKIGDKENQNNRKFIEAYPNPTSDFVNILINKDFDNATIEIYNITGQYLQSIVVKYRSTPISLENYPSGLYIAKINYDNQTESIKIIKK